MFQLIIASNGQETFTVFLFPESGIQWVRGTGKTRWVEHRQRQWLVVSPTMEFKNPKKDPPNIQDVCLLPLLRMFGIYLRP